MNGDGSRSQLEWASPKILHCGRELWLCIVLFLKNSHSTYHEIHCCRKSLALPKVIPLLSKNGLVLSPVHTVEVTALLSYKLCNTTFLKSSPSYFLFCFILNDQPSWPLFLSSSLKCMKVFHPSGTGWRCIGSQYWYWLQTTSIKMHTLKKSSVCKIWKI